MNAPFTGQDTTEERHYVEERLREITDLSYADVEEKLLRELGSRRRELGESLRHQRAAVKEVAFFDWMLIADNAIHRHTMLDALQDAETWTHLQRTLAGELRQGVEDAKDETITRFFETYEAGQR